jgi:hypothetical protein
MIRRQNVLSRGDGQVQPDGQPSLATAAELPLGGYRF